MEFNVEVKLKNGEKFISRTFDEEFAKKVEMPVQEAFNRMAEHAGNFSRLPNFSIIDTGGTEHYFNCDEIVRISIGKSEDVE